ASGKVLDAPCARRAGLMSPSNPFLGGNPATQPNSRGYEAMAMNPKGTHLYAALEGATATETGSTRRLVFEFSVREEAFTGRVWSYQTEQPAFMVADMWGGDRGRLLVVRT